MAGTATSVFIGVGSHVVALDPATGTEQWRTRLKMASIVTVSVMADRVMAGAAGELFCLDSATGAILWRNNLKGLGTGLVAFTGGDTAAAAQALAQAAAAAAASA